MKVNNETCLLTRNQQLVNDVLFANDGPLTAYQILDTLRDDGLKAPLQIYRALEKLMELGLVHRLESTNAYLFCRQINCSAQAGQAFAICDNCGKVAEFPALSSTRHLSNWASYQSFSISSTMIELHGLCANCQKKPPANKQP
ncbi:MAG: Fur family transcriptional regulator [Granulosicoccus sp.]